jgi:multimeric flavodoxin WrbA
MNVIAICSSPRRNGNSSLLAETVLEGARNAGHTTKLVYLADYLESFLRDCRQCRDANGRCTIGDRFEVLLHDNVLTADAVIFATPLYWYGMSGQLKTFFDRIFCYIAASNPNSAAVIEHLCHKRIALVLSSEESYVGAPLGVLHQLQEYSRYTHSTFVGVVHGIGNCRGEVRQDPGDPMSCARQLGQCLFDRQISDYRIDTPRASSVWCHQASCSQVGSNRP